MERPDSLKIVLSSAEGSMTINFDFDKEKPEGERDERIVKILEQFSHLSPAKQEEVLKYIDYLDKKETGQGPVNS